MVQILNVNDEDPVIDLEEFGVSPTVTIPETEQVGNTILTIFAHDPDGSKLRFELEPVNAEISFASAANKARRAAHMNAPLAPGSNWWAQKGNCPDADVSFEVCYRVAYEYGDNGAVGELSPAACKSFAHNSNEGCYHVPMFQSPGGC